MHPLNILYEDNNCIVTEKLQGFESEESSGRCMPALLREYLSSKGEEALIYPVHRLDKPTGGAMVYAKSSEAAAELCASIAHRELGKRYLAVLSGIPEASAASLSDLLYHDKRQNKVFVVKSERKGAKKARLDYRVISTVEYEGEPFTLVEIVLLTGRTHQIRAQFSSRRLPVFGDRRYGCRQPLPCGRIALWSHFLILTPPKENKAISVMSVPPNEFPWSLFPSLDKLRDKSGILND